MEKFSPQFIVTKNNKTVQIRLAHLCDAEPLLDCIGKYIPDSPFIPKMEHEIRSSAAVQKTWIKSFLDAPNSLLIVAEYQGKIVGNLDLTGHSRKLMQHTAVLGMGILKEWRNSGLGTALLRHAIQWAQQNPLLELLWLQVYTANISGISLYKKLGFEESGVMKDFFKHDDEYFDNLTMTLRVK